MKFTLNLRALTGVAAMFMLLFTGVPAFAVDQQAEKQRLTNWVNRLSYRSGQVMLANSIARLELSPNYKYLDPENTKIVVEELWGNPPEHEGYLGMILPAQDSPLMENSWAVLITYEEDGYVNDENAEAIDYDSLLRDIQEDARSSNENREKEGYPRLEVVGWAQAPHYSKSDHKLYWAKEIRFEDSEVNILNYDVRILERKGALCRFFGGLCACLGCGFELIALRDSAPLCAGTFLASDKFV